MRICCRWAHFYPGKPPSPQWAGSPTSALRNLCTEALIVSALVAALVVIDLVPIIAFFPSGRLVDSIPAEIHLASRLLIPILAALEPFINRAL